MKEAFEFYLPVRLIFGPGKAETLGKEAARYGKKALIVTGRSSTKKSGLLNRAVKLLEKGFRRIFLTRQSRIPWPPRSGRGRKWLNPKKAR